MKLFVAIFCFALIFIETLALVAPAVNQHGQVVHDSGPPVPLNCEYHCTDVDVPICANNGQCLQKFKGKCAASAYNCKNPQKPFVIVEDWKCEHIGAPTCGPKELTP